MDGPGLPEGHYYLHRRFVMPTEGGGKYAVAIPKSQELLVVSIYTIIVGGVFTAWWIILMTALPYIIYPRRLRNTKAIAKVANWDMTEPLQAAVLMGRISWKSVHPHLNYVFLHSVFYCCNMWGRRLRTKPYSQRIHEPKPQPVQWRGLFVALIVLLCGLGTSVAGILCGIYLPGRMVLGNVAPVNETIVTAYFPRSIPGNFDNPGSRYPNPIRRKPARRAMSIYDSSTIIDELDEKINVTKTPAPKGPNGEEGYGIEYKFSLSGWEMGLMNLPTLTYGVVGKCAFEYGWYAGVEDQPGTELNYTMQMEKYTWNEKDHWPGFPSLARNWTVDILLTRFDSLEKSVIDRAEVKTWPDPDTVLDKINSSMGNYPTMGFVFLPGTSRTLFKYTANTDPWYITSNTTLRINPGRPALNCQEWVSWHYKGTRLGDRISTLLDDSLINVEPHRYNNQTRTPLVPGLGINIPEGIARLLAVSFSIPLAARFVSTVLSGKLESTNRRFSENTMSLAGASAYLDVKRAVGVGYILGRNIFRDAARNYADPDMPESFKTDLNMFYNVTTRKPFPGTGDFVVPSADVTTLWFGVVLGLPLAFALSWMLAWIVMWLKPVPKIVQPDHNELHADYTCIGSDLKNNSNTSTA